MGYRQPWWIGAGGCRLQGCTGRFGEGESSAGPVDAVTVLLDPWHAKDPIVGVFQGRDDHVGGRGLRIKEQVDLERGGANGSIESTNRVVGFGGIRK